MESKNRLSRYGKRWLRLYTMEEAAERVIYGRTALTEKVLDKMYKQINKWVTERDLIEPNLSQTDKDLISNECGCPMFDY